MTTKEKNPAKPSLHSFGVKSLSRREYGWELTHLRATRPAWPGCGAPPRRSGCRRWTPERWVAGRLIPPPAPAPAPTPAPAQAPAPCGRPTAPVRTPSWPAWRGVALRAARGYRGVWSPAIDLQHTGRGWLDHTITASRGSLLQRLRGRQTRHTDTRSALPTSQAPHSLLLR